MNSRLHASLAMKNISKKKVPSFTSSKNQTPKFRKIFYSIRVKFKHTHTYTQTPIRNHAADFFNHKSTRARESSRESFSHPYSAVIRALTIFAFDFCEIRARDDREILFSPLLYVWEWHWRWEIIRKSVRAARRIDFLESHRRLLRYTAR